MIEIKGTVETNAEFLSLAEKLLAKRDDEAHRFYAQFNKPVGLEGVVLASDGDEVAGCWAFKKYESEVAEIKRTFVLPEKRGKRIAATILAELEAWASELNYTECILETGFKQPEAIALYQREGYTTIPNYGQYGNVGTSVCRKKPIAAYSLHSEFRSPCECRRLSTTLNSLTFEDVEELLYLLRKTAPPKVSSKITLTKAFVVKNAAFIRERSVALMSVCW